MSYFFARALWGRPRCLRDAVVQRFHRGRRPGNERSWVGWTRGQPGSRDGHGGLPELVHATHGQSGRHAAEDATVGVMPLRRLGKIELANTLRDLLPGLPADYDGSTDLTPDNGVELAFAVPGTVSDLEVNRFMDMAEAAIATLGSSAPGNLFNCQAADESSCARAFVESFGKRASRRPLATVEVDDLMALYDKLRTDPEMPSASRRRSVCWSRPCCSRRASSTTGSAASRRRSSTVTWSSSTTMRSPRGCRTTCGTACRTTRFRGR